MKLPQQPTEYSQYTHKRIQKLSHLSEEQKAELLKEMTLSDDELKAKMQKETAHGAISLNAQKNREFYDAKLEKEQARHKKNLEGPILSPLFNEQPNTKKEYLVKMFLYLDKRHAHYEEDKKAYTPEQLAIVEKLEKESNNKVKFVVDTNFLKAFNKIMGVDYRGAAVLGKYVIVGDHRDLTAEGLLRHEAIHCAQQRDTALNIPYVGTYAGMARWTLISAASKIWKQFAGPEKFTPSAVDYGTDNQVTDLETYMNQFNPEYLKHRKKFDHKKYSDKNFLQSEYKRVAKQELDEMKSTYDILEQKRQTTGLSLEEEDRLKKLTSDIQQFERMMEYIEHDEQNRVVLIGPDVLPVKADRNNPEYDMKAGVRTETKTNRDSRIKLEKNLYTTYQQKLEDKKTSLKTAKTDKEKEEIVQEIKEYEHFLNSIKGDRDKSRKKARQDRKKFAERNQNNII